MNYSKIIRDELNKFYKNELLFASDLYKEKLYNKNVSETSYYKLLERMYENKEIEKLSKGIYYFPKTSKYGVIPISDNEIISEFTKKNKGMVVGYYLYNKLNLTTQISKKHIIYTSNVKNEKKIIRNFEIKNIKLNFNNEYIKIIEMLEVLQNFYKIQDINYKNFYHYAKTFANSYNENITNKVLKIINYKKSTISSLENLLNYFGIKNNLNNYLSSLSKYNHIDMERIYELTRTQERF